MPAVTGRVFETGECAHCGRLIRHADWGCGGTLWTHVDTGMVLCVKPVQAEPLEGSVSPVSQESG